MNMTMGNKDELTFLISAGLVALAFVAHQHGGGLSSFQQLASVATTIPVSHEESIDVETLPIPVCPFAESSSVVIISFDQRPLRGVIGPLEQDVAARIEPGVYTIRAFSYDQSQSRETEYESFEQWTLELVGMGTTVAVFPPTRDLPDGLPLTRSFDTLVEMYTLFAPVDRVIARHAHPTRHGNSVTPLCVVFERES